MFLRMLPFFGCLLPLSAATTGARAVDFNRDIRPILSDRCFTCHGPDEKTRKADLRFDTKDGLFVRKGLIEPGDSAKSRLVRRILAKEPPTRMPPVGEALTARQSTLIKQWIDEGARWEDHWSYVPPQRPEEPKPVNSKWSRNAIDRFVLARLEKEGLKPSAEADRATLLRRVTFDLTGLPPTPDEVRAFLADKSPDAYEKQVDRLLASPRYGEKMAMQWLDLARYADTHGFHIDSHRDMWRWRDWVIRSFNENKPFNQFGLEQLAGDLLPAATKDQILASGFNRNHMINFEGGAIPEEYQNEYMVDRIETTATVFMGMTMGCARCHDHKYDPIRQKDFYSFGAFFNTIPEKGLDGQKGNAEPLLLLPTPDQEKRDAEVKARIPEVEKALAADSVKAAFADWKRTAADGLRPASRDALIAHYEFDGSLADSSGKYNHGRSLRDEGAFGTSTTGDRALELSGRSEIELAALPFPKTLSLWFQTRARTFHTGILARMNADRQGWELYLDAPYAIPRMKQKADLVFRRVERWPDRVWEARLKDHLLLGRNRWFHIAITGDKLFINGEPAEYVVVKNTLSKPFAEVQGPVTIGGRKEADRLRGRIDDLRFYDRELNPSEIRALFEHQPLITNLALPKLAKEQDEDLRQYFLAHAAPTEARQLYAELQKLKIEQEDLEWQIPSVMVMAEMEKPRDTFVLGRGDYRNHLEKVTPDVPAAMPPLPKDAPRNRLTLARWLFSGDHPLTARVAVNRYWQSLFGAGLVKTSEDFGSQGEPPISQPLLDWLASEFVRTNWDVKGIHKLLVTSATYRQSSKGTPALREKDPENRFLARGPRHRLPAESIRDLALASSGLMNSEIGGPSVLPYQPPGLWEELAFGAEFSAQTYQQSHGKDLYRRSMYTFWKRTSPPASMSIFDAPDREKCIARRAITNTPIQALALLNDPTFVEAARSLAQRVIRDAGPGPARRLDQAFQLVMGRRPSSKEAAILIDLIKQKSTDYAKNPTAAQALVAVGESKADATIAAPELAAWTTAMSVLLNLDETVTKE